MKNNLLICFALILLLIKVQTVFSQNGVTYTMNNFGNAGDTFRISKAYNFLKYNYDTTGQNIVWDYSQIESYTQYVQKIVTPSSTGYTFTPVSFENSLNLAIPVNDTIYAGTYELYDIYEYFSKANNKLSQLAISGKADGYSLKSKYTSPDVYYSFPLTYGNPKDSSNSSFSISIPLLLYFNQSQKRVNSIEGYGTIITPYGTFDAIKYKSIVYVTDTSSVSGKGLPASVYTVVNLQWLTPTLGFPVFSLTQKIVGGLVTSETVEFIDSIRSYIVKAAFLYNPLAPKEGESVVFQNITQNAFTYKWNFGDTASGSNNTSPLHNPTHIYKNPGKYLVTLIGSNATNTDTSKQFINVTDTNNVVAKFTYLPLNPVFGRDTVTFYNLSKNANTYLWNFGDSTTSTTNYSSFKHIYKAPGSYNVTLIAYKDTYSDTATSVVKLTAMPLAAFTVSEDTVYQGSTVSFTNESENATSFIWKINNVLFSLKRDTAYKFNQPGKYKITLIAINNLLTDSTSQNVLVDTLYSISGILSYDNTESTGLYNILLYLRNTEGTKTDSTTTDYNGNYIFNNLNNGKYLIQPQITKNWGGVNPTDALVVNRYYIKLSGLKDNLLLKAADVNADNKVNPIDALTINRRYIKLINSFKSGDWIYQKDTLTVKGSNVLYNFKAVCVGDVNGSYIPPK